MKEQNYKNHRQLVPTWHGLTGLAVFVLLVGSIRNLIYCPQDQVYSASLLVLGSVVLILLYLHIRRFALRAQDRAIRAEENLRYFQITGKRLDGRLTTKQVIALRFAGDEELPTLAQHAADESLTPDQIKKAVRNWREDWYRV